METFFTYIDKGGIIFSSLFLLSIITISIVTFKFIEIFLIRKLDFSKLSNFLDSNKFNTSIKEIDEIFIDTLPKSKKIIFSNIMDLINSNKSKSDIENELNVFLSKEFKKISSFLPSLEVISQVSPLIGLLGTVIGMIDSFNELELGGSLVDPSILAGGIWTALLTTAMGLIVAIPALISHYFFDKKVNELYEDFEDLIARLYPLK